MKMENGVGMIDDSVMVDNKIVEERVANEKVEERVVGGTDETTDAEDEVFQEAIGTLEHLQEQTEKSGLGDGSLVADAIGNGEIFGDTGSEEVLKNSNLEPEAETFEEAIGVPTKVGSQEDVVTSVVEPQEDVGVSVDEQKVEELSGAESVGGGVVADKIDEGGTEMGAGTDKLNGGKEVAEISGTGETEVLSDENEGNLKSDTVIEKPVNADKTHLEGTLTDEKLETLEGDKVEENVKVESKLEFLPREGKGEESREDALATDYQDTKVGESAGTSAGMIVKLQDNEVVEELNNKSANVETGDQGKESMEAKGATAGMDSVDGGDEVEKINKALAAVEAEDNRNGQVKDSSDSTDINYIGEIDELKDKLSELSKTVEGTVAPEFGNLSSSEKFTGEGNDKIEAGKTDLRTEANDGFQSRLPVEMVDKFQDIHCMTEESKKKGEKDQEDKQSFEETRVQEVQHAPGSSLAIKAEESGKKPDTDQEPKPNTPVIREREIQPASVSSSYVKSINSATPPHPAVHGHAALLLDPEESGKKADTYQELKPSTPVIREREIPPAQVSSSSVKSKSSATPSRPAGLGRASPLLDPEESGKKADTYQEVKPSTPVIREREIPPAQVSSSSVKSKNSATPSRPAGLGRAAPLLDPAPRMVQQPPVNGSVSQAQAPQIEDPANREAEESDETREKLQLIRVKFLRLAHRLGQTPHNVVVAQVLYRLGLAEQLRGGNGGRVGAFSFDRASAMAEQLEAVGNEPLDFSCTIMVLGKTGVGKSATINSIFDEVKFGTDAFQTSTKKVQDVVGTVHGIKVRVIDTPGLLPSWSDQRQNEKILHSVKHFIKKTPPDIVLYLDRLDLQTRDFGDMPLLRTITEIFGPSIWFNAIVVLTHAASAPPDGPNGTASSYDMFVTQRSHVVQQAIRQAAGDMRLMNPVSLVENHSACRTNRAGQRVLPNGQVWKPHLLLLSFASKMLAEANTLLKLQDTPPGKPFATRTRTPPLPFLLSSLLQSRPQVKLPEEQYGDDDGLDDDLDESSDSEDESEYDELPPFKRLTKAQIAKLTKAQKKAYFDELEYREKLFMKKQLKEEKKRQKMMRKMAAADKDLPSEYGENAEEESSGASSVPVPLPDLALPVSFDSDNPTHRYRFLDSSNPWLVRPVLDAHGWDHDVGYEGINVERLFVAKDKYPISFSGQITKDKKDANVQMELASSLKHGEGKATSLGFDMQTVGKDLAYTLRSETRFSNIRKNKASAGISVTLLGDALSAGVKVEDKLIANKRLQVVMTGGAMTGRGDLAYGGSLEAQLRDKDYPLGRSLSTLGLSVMDWHGDLAIGCNIQSQVPVGRSTNLIARANLNNRGAGQVSIRMNSSEQLQLALVALLPLMKKLLEYPKQMQYGR
ncbi:translocase of chloroplast 120, chloroplastic-like [Durio zibethinus]|uniref:Translocase of chloroplast 120, chloroplastic-like n=1 Tax=Durio zibethinus TaxID=66656 RepID=A0A6P6ADZ6_DURZI|nr:translocase of chloroplast 120, chloroplastic-like [Durio zibethinus]XP_022763077.1 translocase of chloroplast 120, chloroplastic-like [Durio zibethinus]